MEKRSKNKMIEGRTVQTLVYIVIGLLCLAIVFSVISVHKNSLKIENLKEIQNDIKIIKENMVIIGEKAGMTPSELTVLNSRFQDTQVGEKQADNRKVVNQQDITTGSTMIDIRNIDKEVEQSTSSLLKERLKSYGGLLEKSEGLSESKIVEEPIPKNAPEKVLQIPQATNIRKKTQESKSSVKTIQKYHIVQRGETLGHIAKKYHISIQELGKLNNIDPSQLIYPGQKLIVSKDGKK